MRLKSSYLEGRRLSGAAALPASDAALCTARRAREKGRPTARATDQTAAARAARASGGGQGAGVGPGQPGRRVGSGVGRPKRTLLRTGWGGPDRRSWLAVAGLCTATGSRDGLNRSLRTGTHVETPCGRVCRQGTRLVPSGAATGGRPPLVRLARRAGDPTPRPSSPDPTSGVKSAQAPRHTCGRRMLGPALKGAPGRAGGGRDSHGRALRCPSGLPAAMALLLPAGPIAKNLRQWPTLATLAAARVFVA